MGVQNYRSLMSKFPDRLRLPRDVSEARQKRDQQVLKGALIGISCRFFVILFECIGLFFISSSVLFLDVLSNLMDVTSTLFLLFCIRLARRPPDHHHPFGHGRYEPLGGLLLGLVFICLGSVMLIHQTYALFEKTLFHPIHSWSWLFPAIAMIILEMAYHLMIRIAKQENSPLLKVEALHYRLDSLTSLFATLALLGASYLPAWGGLMDHGGAIVIALFMIGMGMTASWENVNQLMDKTPPAKFFERVRLAALKTPGVKDTEKIRIQQYGPDAHVDIDIEVSPDLPVDKAHEISQQVRLEIQKAWPAVRDVTVHIEPYYVNDH